jgi:hypothetical protein
MARQPMVPTPAAPPVARRPGPNAKIAGLPEAPPAGPSPTCGLSEAARLSSLCEETLRRGFDAGKIPGWRLQGGQRLFDRAFILKLAEQLAAERAKGGAR